MADRAEEKENRINSFALSFLERQQIVPNLYADQIVRGYKEGYHQAEKDLCQDAYVYKRGVKYGYDRGYKQAEKDTVEKACRCYCDSMCERGMVGMCYYKHDGKGQIKNSFRYNECYELKIMRKAMEE